MKLTNTQKKVLFRIEHELSIKLPLKFSEFPYLLKEDIRNTIAFLAKERLIIFNKNMNFWETTEKGSTIIGGNKNEFKAIDDEFNKNIYLKK